MSAFLHAPKARNSGWQNKPRKHHNRGAHCVGWRLRPVDERRQSNRPCCRKHHTPLIDLAHPPNHTTLTLATELAARSGERMEAH